MTKYCSICHYEIGEYSKHYIFYPRCIKPITAIDINTKEKRLHVSSYDMDSIMVCSKCYDRLKDVVKNWRD